MCSAIVPRTVYSIVEWGCIYSKLEASPLPRVVRVTMHANGVEHIFATQETPPIIERIDTCNTKEMIRDKTSRGDTRWFRITNDDVTVCGTMKWARLTWPFRLPDLPFSQWGLATGIVVNREGQGQRPGSTSSNGIESARGNILLRRFIVKYVEKSFLKILQVYCACAPYLVPFLAAAPPDSTRLQLSTPYWAK